MQKNEILAPSIKNPLEEDLTNTGDLAEEEMKKLAVEVSEKLGNMLESPLGIVIFRQLMAERVRQRKREIAISHT